MGVLRSPTYPDIVISSARGQSSLAMRLEVCRVDGSILGVPVDDDGCGFHDGRRLGAIELPTRVSDSSRPKTIRDAAE